MQKTPWRRIALTVSAMLMVLLLAVAFRFVQSRGAFASAEDKTPASCRAVAGISGVTAMANDPLGVFVAAKGGLYQYTNGTATRLAGTPADFRPVALGASGPVLQTVFARADGTYAIAIFAFQPGKVTEMGRLTADVVTDPSDLVAIDGQRFYLVNRHATKTALGRWLDDTFLIPRAEVLYFDGMKFVKVATRLSSPSGLALAPDLSHLYVAQELPRTVVAFARTEFTGGLSDAALADLPAAPIKITTAPDGSLIVAAWPKRGSGAVYRIPVENGALQKGELVYASKTEPVTAAAEIKGHLLIGTDKALLDCR